MPRCLMAKKWKSYPWTDREGGLQILDQNEPSARQEEDDEEIDVVGDANDCSQVSSCWVPIPAPNGWSPSSPTAGATAPSPPPAQSGLDMASRIAVLYNEAIKQEIPLESSLSSGKSENLRKHLEIRSKY
ncbi:hypothetical protein RUM44_009736 [Polyplax serrata]|uniref:Uncharacterized protein n=1 Tax=Polyplax serrata TaxID=468196 RepID=A0ABR1ATJ9_POLSC